MAAFSLSRCPAIFLPGQNAEWSYFRRAYARFRAGHTLGANNLVTHRFKFYQRHSRLDIRRGCHHDVAEHHENNYGENLHDSERDCSTIYRSEEDQILIEVSFEVEMGIFPPDSVRYCDKSSLGRMRIARALDDTI